MQERSPLSDPLAVQLNACRCAPALGVPNRGPPEADELLARAGFVQNTDYKWPHGAAPVAASPAGGGNGARL